MLIQFLFIDIATKRNIFPNVSKESSGVFNSFPTDLQKTNVQLMLHLRGKDILRQFHRVSSNAPGMPNPTNEIVAFQEEREREKQKI